MTKAFGRFNSEILALVAGPGSIHSSPDSNMYPVRNEGKLYFFDKFHKGEVHMDYD